MGFFDGTEDRNEQNKKITICVEYYYSYFKFLRSQPIDEKRFQIKILNFTDAYQLVSSILKKKFLFFFRYTKYHCKYPITYLFHC